MYATILSSAIVASVAPPWDYYDEIEVGQQWEESDWSGTFTTAYTNLGEFARFEYTLFLDPESSISLTDFTLLSRTGDMLDWQFDITGGSTLFISFETPQIGYTTGFGTLYNDDVFGSADVFQTIAPIPSPGAVALLGLAGLSSRKRRK